jgi:glutamate-ammonia-ligase adenylyltransferase
VTHASFIFDPAQTLAKTESRITRVPREFDVDRGAEARHAVPNLNGAMAELIAGAASCAPYLHGLILKESGWLEAALLTPEMAFLAELQRIDTLGASELNTGLRQAKRRVALLAGLCDLGGIWPLHQVTGALSDLADHATHIALKTHVTREIERSKLPGQSLDDIESCGGMVAIAMGKHGAGELNYSSDIDLICLFDETRFDPDDRFEARASFIRATRGAMASLSDLTAEGYVFRTDLRLRPDPSVTPVCFAMNAAEHYYEREGRTWERAAYIKARAAAGDVIAGERFLQAVSPFVWRKHLDFAAIQETHDMRLKIREHKGLGGPLVLENHNVKLGLGGIREIEFFAQTRQLIAGGRDPSLRLRGTCEALSGLAARDWITAQERDVLTVDYTAHRDLEHRLQMLRDAQTHNLPRAPEEFERLACLMDVDVQELRRDVFERCLRVNEMTEGFFAPSAKDVPPREASVPREIVEIARRWPGYPALRSERAQEIFKRLEPDFMRRINLSDQPLEVAGYLDGFLRGLPAGVQVFSLFDANTQLVDLIFDIVSTAPHLASYLSRNSGVLDAVIGGAFFEPWPEQSGLEAELAGQLSNAASYEVCLDTSRRWSKEWHFRIGVHQLRGLISADEAGRQYCDLARASIAALFPYVEREFAVNHGAAPGRGAMVLAMGSLGAGRLSAASDLDVIVIYDAAGSENSDGLRPLASRSYYARFTQTLITAVTAQTAQGRLYEMDMRLRPSGRQGPVATSLESFTRYQNEEAWVWEHLALTRADPLIGDKSLMADVAQVRFDLIEHGQDEGKVRAETSDMRGRLAQAKPGSTWDPKSGAGRLMDIELLAEAAALLAQSRSQCIYEQLEAGEQLGWLTGDEHQTLAKTYRLMWRLQSAARLLSGEKLSPDTIGTQGRAFLLRSTKMDTMDALEAEMTRASLAASQVLDTVLARPAVLPAALPGDLP